MALITIDRETCTRCGLCAVECPEQIIAFKEGSYPRTVVPAEPLCLTCGHCVAVCPSGSLYHRDIPLEQCVSIDSGLKITPEQYTQMVKGRRSVRIYRDRPVPREIITRLIDTARYAPTGHNEEEVEWLVVDNPEKLKRLEKIGAEWMRWTIENQPEMATAMNMQVFLKRQKKNLDTILRGAPVLVVAHGPGNGPIATVDCTIALSYLDLFANTMGLGSCWAGFAYFMATSFPPMQEALALPEGRAIGGCMMLGYPDHGYARIPPRQAARITWHD